MKFVLITGGVLVFLFVMGWLGLKISPSPIPLSSEASSSGVSNFVGLPDTNRLPGLARSFYSDAYGRQLPVIESAIISGTGSMNINGITFPARFCFIHQAGQAYRHYFELTLWGVTIMRVNEYYSNGEARLELPFGIVEYEPKVNQGANLALWAEALWYPSIYVTHPGVEWKATDTNEASLSVPFGSDKQQIYIRFNSRTHMPESMQAMRYKSPESKEKTSWLIEPSGWKNIGKCKNFTEAAITWLDEGQPWARFSVDQILLNPDVGNILTSKSRPALP